MSDINARSKRDDNTSGQMKDENTLANLGYKQELKRGWNVFQSFGISFSIISVVTGIVTLFETGLNTGGPAAMSVGWIIVSIFTFFVALAMSEIVSAVPTSGGPYHWAAITAPPRHSALAAWVTGYFNMLGQVAVTTGISFGCAGLITTLASLHDFNPTPGNTIGIFAAILVSHGIINSFGVKALGVLNWSSVALHSIGVGSLAIAVLAKAPTHRTAAEVFGFFYDGTAVTEDALGWSVRASPAYVAVCGCLLAQYTLTGFDASAHMSEEIHDASWAAPIGVITSVGVSAVFGFFLLLSLLFSIQDFDATVNSEAGQPVLQILLDIFGEKGATALMILIILCIYHCGLFSVTANSRMMYAFSRDRGLPAFFNHVDHRFQSPIRTVWLSVLLSFLLAVPSLGSAVAFSAATSIATIGLYISYGIPIGILFFRGKEFNRGPFHLGRYSRPIGAVACLWICFITVVFVLPTQDAVNSQTLNYTVVAVGIITLWTFGSWFLWARKWFTGPRLAALEEIQKDPGAISQLGVTSRDSGSSIPEKEVSGGAKVVQGVETD